MILGLLIIILILYGLVLFWVLNERLKTISSIIRRTNDQLKKMEEKFSLLLSITEERGNVQPSVDQPSVDVEDCFSFETFENQPDDSHSKGEKE